MGAPFTEIGNRGRETFGEGEIISSFGHVKLVTERQPTVYRWNEELIYGSLGTGDGGARHPQ